MPSKKEKSLVAIKSVQLYKLNKKLKDNLTSEIKILRSLQHPHIVSLIDCQESTAYMHIVMEFCELGDLSAFIKKRSSLADHPATADMMRKYPNPPVGGLNEVIVRHFAKQIASALEFLQAKSYIHRDLKPQNLLLNPSPLFYASHKPDYMPFAPGENSLVPAAGIESLPMLKVADFGFARFLPQTSLAETLCGSPLYMAPEILRYENYNAKADLWSVGTVLHEMMVARPPFRAQNHVELLRKIEKQDDRIKFPEDLAISRAMKNLIRSLLKRRPVERVSFEDFFDDPVIKGEIPGLVGQDRPKSVIQEEKAMNRREQKQRVGAQGASKDSGRSDSLPHTSHERTPQGTTPPSRPASRTPSNTVQPMGSPKQATSSRKSSNTSIPAEQPSGVPTRRPTITSHITAPARPTSDRDPVAAAVATDRRNSRNSPSPGSSVLKEHFDRERIPPTERALRDARERAAQDLAFEREYVMVEKRSVEVNALADELAASPMIRGQRPTSPQHAAIVRRSTIQGSSPTSALAAHASARAMQMAPNRQRTEALHHRTGSYERRYGKIPGSVTSAISNALNAVAMRSGLGMSPPMPKGFSPPKGFAGFPVYPTAQSSMLMVGDVARPSDIKDEEITVLKIMEELAHRSNVVYGFAEVKYKQLIPATPSDQGLGITGRRVDADTEDDEELTLDAILVISEEAFVLYVKAIQILGKSMDIVGHWWNKRQLGNDGSTPRSLPNPSASSTRMSSIVQWIRNRFNECIDKANFAAQKLADAQKQLPSDHRHHPSNRPSFSSSLGSVGSTENIWLPTGITAEKLMYDRAIEMSKAAAVNELVGEDLPGCEINYMTAIQMLQAVLDTDEDVTPKGVPNARKDDKHDEDMLGSLEIEDKEVVQKRELHEKHQG